MDRRILTVEGMSCTGCESNVTTALSEVDGVHDVSADHEHDRVEIEVSESVDDATIAGAIESAGYTLRAQA